jgi:hypothetical protein
MDRHIVQIGAVPQDTDILYTNLHSYISIAKLSAALLGTSTKINGFTCTQTSSPGMSVLIGPGEIYALEEIDTSAYGSLPTNSNVILKQGIQLNTITTTTMTAPSTAGQSINYLIEFAFNEVDGGATVLTYYNSENPTQTFDGPNNDAQPNYVVRQDQVTYQIKAGTAATTGSQTTPSPDAGYVGAWVVTIAHGQTTIINADIAEYVSAPFINNTQNIIQSNSYLYGADSSGVANTVTVTLNPVLSTYTTGMTVFVKIANNNTGNSTININSLGSKNITLSNATALVGGELVAGQISQLNYDGTEFQLSNPANAAANAINSINVQTLSSHSSTYTPTSGMVMIKVRMVGAGGGSGAITNAGAYAVASGGNSGSYLEFWMTAAQVGASLSYGAGTSGSAGTSGGAGGNGTSSTFGSWTATGGTGGGGQAGVSASTISSVPSANSANTIGTGTLILSIPGASPSIGFALTSPLFAASSIGGNSFLVPYSQLGVGASGNFYIAAANAAGIAGSSGGSYQASFNGNGATGAIALDSAANQSGAVGGEGIIIVEEYLN